MSEEKKSESSAEATDADGKPKKAAGKPKARAKSKGKKKKKKPPPGPPKPPLMDRLRANWEVGRSGFKDILYSFISADRPTRKMSRVFLLSLVGFMAVGAGAVYRYQTHYLRIEKARLAKEMAEHRKEELARLEAEALKKHKMVYLGEFGVELRKVQGQESMKGLLNQASIELVAECDGAETRAWIEQELIRVRGQVTQVLMSLSRKEIFSRDGKLRLRKALADKINGALPHGKVLDVYFTGLIVN